MRSSPKMDRSCCKRRPFTAGPFCVFLAMLHMLSHVHCFVVDIYGLDQNLTVMATWSL